ncbi:MAG: carbon-nitrogen hydrolase family protein [Planctomycetota bacterium]
MRLSVAQPKLISADIPSNLDRHIALIELAVSHGIGSLLFPELSLTGYEPSSAMDLAAKCERAELHKFQSLSDRHDLSIGVGLPLATETLPQIAIRQFRPNLSTRDFSKCYLHEDELPYFSCSNGSCPVIHDQPNISLAICYEISIAEHARRAFDRGSSAYVACTAKTEINIDEAHQRMSAIAKSFGMITMLSNSLGVQDNAMCVGRTAAWSRAGKKIAELDGSQEGLIIADLETEDAWAALV